jgi:hypothetical protein
MLFADEPILGISNVPFSSRFENTTNPSPCQASSFILLRFLDINTKTSPERGFIENSLRTSPLNPSNPLRMSQAPEYRKYRNRLLNETIMIQPGSSGMKRPPDEKSQWNKTSILSLQKLCHFAAVG